MAVYRFRLSHKHNEWRALARPIGLHDTVKRFFPLTRRGWHLYSSSVGMMIRGPIYRLIIISTIGLHAAAVFDIAMRLTQTVREVIATGFSVLFPSFSFLSRNGDRARTIELVQISLMVLLSLGTLSLGLLIGAISPILSLWRLNPHSGWIYRRFWHQDEFRPGPGLSGKRHAGAVTCRAFSPLGRRRGLDGKCHVPAG